MKRNEFKDITLPALGFGAMRLPIREDKSVDLGAVEKMVDCAMAHGVNYFDTGFDYHGGASETALAAALKKYPRESYYLADKFPGYDKLKWKKVETTFNEQLSRCNTDHFDFYLFHNVSEMNVDAYLDEKYGIFDFLARQKAEGKIKYLGFSVHGSTETTEKFLSAYGKYMDFGQIQLNYIDYKFQHADEKLALFEKYNIPVWVMEPLRGGKLCALRAPFDKEFEANFPNISPREAAFRFVSSFPAVKLTLSGMSNFDQLAENIDLFSSIEPLDATQTGALISLAEKMTALGTVPCTGCNYCTEHCPIGLDIPTLIGFYNEHSYSGGGFIAPMAVLSLERKKRPNACLACGKCASVCPQNIKIPEVLERLSDMVGLRVK